MPLRRVVLASVLLALVPATAEAADVDVAVAPDPLVDRPVTFTTAATTDGAEVFVYAKLRPRDANPCGATASAETGRDLFSRATGGQVASRKFETAAPMLLCAYLAESSNAAPVAAKAIPFDVRANRASVAVQVPPVVSQNVSFPAAVVGTTEVARNVYARVKPTGAGPCGPSYTTDGNSSAFVFGQSITGSFSVPKAVNRLRDAGTYTACAWVQRASGDAIAEAAGSATFRVSPPRPDLGELSMSTSRFTALTYGSSITRSFGGGTSLSFPINTTATVTFTVRRAAGGRRVGSSCRTPTRALRKRPACTRYVKVPGSFRYEADGPTTQHFRFSGRIGGKQLARGRYRLYARAANVAGRSGERKRAFTIVGRR